MPEPKRVADYPNIPDHSDLRGFSYHAPENFDFRDGREAGVPFWKKVLRWFRGRA
jgi:hypothetical protein